MSTTANHRFRIVRDDGRSNIEVILDMVRDREPGTMFAYDDIATTLEEGTDRTYSRDAVQRIVVAAHKRLLQQQARALINVPTVGYRLAPAAQHVVLSERRKSAAQAQLQRGLNLLQNVRWDEMNPNERAAHEGHLLVMSAVWSQTQAITRRQEHTEKLIRQLFERADEQARQG